MSATHPKLEHEWMDECGPRPARSFSTVLSVGVFLQVRNIEVWPDMLACLSSVVKAQAFVRLGVHISFPSNAVFAQNERAVIESSVRSWVQDVFVAFVDDAGSHIGHFLQQISQAERAGLNYDVLLKMHSETNGEWRNLGAPSMCGAATQVRAILSQFVQRPELSMIAPVGTVFYVGSPMTEVAPIVSKTFGWERRSTVPSSLHDYDVEGFEFLQNLIAPDLELSRGTWTIVSGSMFWVRYRRLRPETWAKHLHSIVPHLIRGYGHAIERFIPTMIQSAGDTIATMPPAPKVYASFLPQYHRIPENDKFWGEGFTEWTLLKPFEFKGIRKPLSVQRGGLGYYDLLERKTRRCQANLARSFGIEGFMYHHYWFANPGIGNRQVMARVPEMMLEDGEPNLPFFFSWANDDWTRQVDGTNIDVILAQNYGDEPEWIAHATYLMRFFQHHNYLKAGHRPVFAIYRPGHLGEKFVPMLRVFDRVAQQHGFDGIYYINTVSNFYKLDGMDSEKFPNLMQSAFHALASVDVRGASRPDIAIQDRRISSVSNWEFVREKRQFWGAYVGFDDIVRYPSRVDRPDSIAPREALHVEPINFAMSLSESFAAMAYEAAYLHDGIDNLFLIVAWNQWNEQCVLEPDDAMEFSYLQALQSALESVAPRDVEKNRHGNEGLKFLQRHNISRFDQRYDFIGAGACVPGTLRFTIAASSVDECANNAGWRNVSYFSYGRQSGQCALASGFCTSGDGRKEFDTYRLKPFTCVTGSGSGCRTCVPADLRMSDSDCASCNTGYTLWFAACRSQNARVTSTPPATQTAALLQQNEGLVLQGQQPQAEHMPQIGMDVLESDSNHSFSFIVAVASCVAVLILLFLQRSSRRRVGKLL